jgi:Mg-chelatase subunit ChlD
VVDLTSELHDSVELLFGTQLGGGTDINRALAYCQGIIRQPHDTIVILISDLYEGGHKGEMPNAPRPLLARACRRSCSWR